MAMSISYSRRLVHDRVADSEAESVTDALPLTADHVYRVAQKTACPSFFHSDDVNNNKYVIKQWFTGILLR